MLTKILKKRTPSLRHKITLINLQNSLNINKFFIKLKKKNSLIKKKYFTKKIKPYLSKVNLIKTPTIFVDYFSLKKNFQTFGLYKTIYGLTYLSLDTSCYFPGFKFYSLNYIIDYLSFKDLIGHIIPLSLIPINMNICSIYNRFNTNGAYALSFGCNAVKGRVLKKVKLTLISLPSKKLKYFNLNTLAIFSANFFFKKKKLIEGSWGKTLKTSKKLIVRGVAKNPVDHPNGGRTKTNKPERSPWGWVAKKNK